MVRIEGEVIEAARKVAAATGVEAAVLLGVALVETNGVAFAQLSGRREPLIRFEGHYFDRLLAPAARDAARRQGLADPRAGRIRNPASQAGRWRLFDNAAAIDAAAAAASVSWGLCQVMGAHWRQLGYGDAPALACAARASAEGQLDLAARFLKLGGLGARLARGDTAGFARGYNGPAYRRNRYDEKIGAAYVTARRLLTDPNAASELGRSTTPAPAGSIPVLRRGMTGAAVRRLQAALVAVGQAIAVDGDFGPHTQTAVEAFQRAAGLAVDGLVGPQTGARLGLVA